NTESAGTFTAYVAQQNNETGCISIIVPVKVAVKAVGVKVTKTVIENVIDGPSTLNYTITIENNGQFDLTEVNITDILTQAGAADETISDIGTKSESGGNPANNDNNKLEVGEKWAYEFTYDADQVRINNGSDLINTVSVSTKEGAAGN